jgi:hypothetical protein
LRAVVKSRVFDSPRSQTATDTTAFIENNYFVTTRNAFACCHESGKTSANNNDAHG